MHYDLYPNQALIESLLLQEALAFPPAADTYLCMLYTHVTTMSTQMQAQSSLVKQKLHASNRHIAALCSRSCLLAQTESCCVDLHLLTQTSCHLSILLVSSCK